MTCCALCEVEIARIRCRHVGPLCWDCWGSGIHEAMKWDLKWGMSEYEWNKVCERAQAFIRQYTMEVAP